MQIENLLISGTVTATSGCIAPTLTLTGTNVSCNGGSNGAITLTTSGGSSPFTYHWSNGATTQNISNLAANTYTVTVTATGGCSATASEAVSQPTALSASTSVTSTSCTASGTATVTASGGTSPYTYSWSTNPVQTAATATALSSAAYIVTVSDHNLCKTTATATVVIQSPTGLNATTITGTSATLNWEAVSGASSYNIQYRKTGTTSWTTASSNSTSTSAGGLTAGTTYEFQVQTVCSSGSSGFTASSDFTSTSPCSTPASLAASQIASSSALLSWGAVSGAASYNAQYRVTGTTNWTTTSSTTVSITLSSLTASTSYDCEVQTICTGGTTSGYSAIVTFVTPASTGACDSTLWNHVYNSYRLIVHQQCTYATGTVAALIYEADGDIHIRLHVDSAFNFMLNSENVSGEDGDLVCEPVCATTVTQTDAIASCENFTNTVFIPNVGEHVKITGSYVTDNDHGWNELHPVTSIVITTQTSSPLLEGLNVQSDKGLSLHVFPNPASDFIYFKLSMQPSSAVRLVIVDGIGRSAGQYQMLENPNLEVNTSYLPSGIYYYNMVQADQVLQSGKFVVAH